MPKNALKTGFRSLFRHGTGLAGSSTESAGLPISAWSIEARPKTKHNDTTMNTKKSLLLASMLAAITALSSVAQTPPTAPPDRPARPEKPPGGRGPGMEVPRIGVPDRVLFTLPQALQDQITKYREQSKTFIDAQRDLAKTLSTATEEQRNTIREQLKANREKFLTDTQQVRTEIRDQLKDLGVSVRENRPADGGGKGQGRPRG